MSGNYSAWFAAASPADNELMYVQITRLPADAGDTLSVDALLIGVRLKFITNEASDDG